MNPKEASIRFGIDLGGTKTEIIGIEARNGKEIYRKRVPSPRDDYQATIQNMANLVMEAEKIIGRPGSVGVGIPGCISQDTGLVKNANSTWLNGNPLDQDLSKALSRPVKCENDANCLAVSEATDGAGAGKNVVFAVIIGTGSGAGIFANGAPVGGRNGIGGEWAHNPLPYKRMWPAPSDDHGVFEAIKAYEKIVSYGPGEEDREHPGPYCYCGKRGCLETWISGPGLKNDYHRVNGEELSTHDIIAAAEKGEPKAAAALARYTDRLARGLSLVINVLDPDVIILGGGMGNIPSLYSDLPKIWGRYIFSDTVHTDLKPPRHGDSSGVRGAAWLWGRHG